MKCNSMYIMTPLLTYEKRIHQDIITNIINIYENRKCFIYSPYWLSIYILNPTLQKLKIPVLLILFSVFIFFFQSNISEFGYIHVPSCPKSLREWEDSSLRLKCNDTHKYHCAPYLNNYEVYQLYELCYRSINVSKGKYFNSLFSK